MLRASGGQEEQHERVQQLRGRRSEASCGHYQRSEGGGEVTSGCRRGDEDCGADESAVGGHDGVRQSKLEMKKKSDPADHTLSIQSQSNCQDWVWTDTPSPITFFISSIDGG
jgi:hypothetical protein